MRRFPRDYPRRENMETVELSPDEARWNMHTIHTGMIKRSDSQVEGMLPYKCAKKHYGEAYQLFAGITAAMDCWDESGDDIEELKEEYSGTFVEGVEIGERLAVYQGKEFTFSTSKETGEESGFTFSH